MKEPEKIEPPDAYHITGAVGWLELGNPDEALEDLSRVQKKYQDHPSVLAIRWDIAARRKHWREAVAFARKMMEQAPDFESSWINRSYALHELGQTEKAREFLLPATEKFPNCWTVFYNLACYDCCLGSLEDARHWLARAMELEGVDTIKERALEDPDLEPLHADLRAQ